MSYLHPESYAAMSLVCKQFNGLVKTPYAWKTAFHRMYSTRSLMNGEQADDIWEDDGNVLNPTHSRFFNRLTTQATWQSEYVLRSQLLRGLTAGRPNVRGVSSTGEAVRRAHAVITYDTRVPCVITNVHADFPSEKLPPRAIHGGADLGLASISNPMTGKLERWAREDIYTLGQAADAVPHLPLYGVAEGPAAGLNVMDVSPTYGFIAGEGFPGGQPYFRPAVGKRGRVVDYGNPLPETYPDIPRPPPDVEGISSVWIAKTSAVPILTSATVGILTGSTLGVVTAYALGRQTSRRKFEDGEMSCRWVLSPGVPIVSIKVDEKYSDRRKAAGRIWAVALNALGEIYYLKDSPTPVGEHAAGPAMVHNAYLTGRTAHWHLVEPSRRTPRSPSDDEAHSPRSSANFMGLSAEGWLDEARIISQWLSSTPTYFRRRYRGWDMRRRMEVDFAADDENGAGEAIFVIDSGYAEEVPAAIQRFSRLAPETPLVNGRKASTNGTYPKVDDWHVTPAILGDVSFLKVTTSAMDMSNCALTTISEDPLAMSEMGSPASPTPEGGASHGIPGERSRFIALGTDKGSIIIWNARDSNMTRISPIKVIHTESPEVSCLGLTALYIVHGGSDGLVQAWDPLALNKSPIRTINTRSGNRIPRHLAQINPGLRPHQYSAATAICMDPDATKLRGVVSFGAFIRSWSYSSGAQPPANRKKSKMDKETALETSDLRELQERNSRLHEKYGAGDLELNEEESLVYALMVSEESLAQDEVRRSEAVEALLLSNGTLETPSSGDASEATASIDVEALSTMAPPSSESFAADFYGGGDPFVDDVFGQDVSSGSQGEFEFAITYKKKGKKPKKGGASRAGPSS